MSFHKLDKAKDKKFWSVRASRDIRLRGNPFALLKRKNAGIIGQSADMSLTHL
jgi:hypothetical protein